MMKVKCDCGKIMYEGISKCPLCGRRITDAHRTTEDFPVTNPTECQGKPCPKCKVEPTYYKGTPYIRYYHKADCGVGSMQDERYGTISTGGTQAPVRPKLPYVCSSDANHRADKEGPCPFCWAIAVALHGE